MRPAPTEAVRIRPRVGASRVDCMARAARSDSIALCIGGTLLNRDFATVDNTMNVLTRTSFIGIIAVGMTFVIISGGIDLSVGSMAALIAGSMIWLMNGLAAGVGGHTFAPLTIVTLGIVLALVFGGLFGLRARLARDQGTHRAVHRDARHARASFARCSRGSPTAAR